MKWKKAYYGVADLGWITEMVAYDVSPTSSSSVAPSSTIRRRWEAQSPATPRVKSLEEAEEPRLRKRIEEAERVPGWM